MDTNEWVYGDLIYDRLDLVFIQCLDSDYNRYKYRIQPETICEFTGKYDMDNTLIFEQDIVEYSNARVSKEKGVVVWGKKRAGFIIKYNAELGFHKEEIIKKSYAIPDRNEVRVIGTTIDNLKGVS